MHKCTRVGVVELFPCVSMGAGTSEIHVDLLARLDEPCPQSLCFVGTDKDLAGLVRLLC